VLGMFAVLDRVDQAAISQEDIRRARALAAHASVALDVKRSLHVSESHRRRSESLMALAQELNPLLRLPEFAQGFVSRAANMMDASAAALAIKQGDALDTVALHGEAVSASQERLLKHRLSLALSEFLSTSKDAVTVSTAP